MQAQIDFLDRGEASRVFCEFDSQTRATWSRARRVVAKGENPRFVVTSLSAAQADARTLYEDLSCARGDMENRIKEQQLDLFADPTSTQRMRANQIRPYFSSFAYVLLCALRRLGRKGTELARAQCGSIRTKLLKIGAQVRISVRRIGVSFCESYPYPELFGAILDNLRSPPPPPEHRRGALRAASPPRRWHPARRRRAGMSDIQHVRSGTPRLTLSEPALTAAPSKSAHLAPTEAGRQP